LPNSISSARPGLRDFALRRTQDYLWAYFGHHYGGGFHDIKAPSGSWAPFFDKMQKGMADAWIYGTSEPVRDGIACRESAAVEDPACLSLRATRGENATIFRSVFREFPNAWVNGVIDDWDRTRGACCERVRDMYRSGLQVQHLIVRPRTPLTADYLRLAHASLDHKAERLRLHPAPKSTSRCCFNHEGGYPVNWAELKGEICHPLYVKYASHVKGGMPMKPGIAYRDRSEDGTKLPPGAVSRHVVSSGLPRPRPGTAVGSHRSPRQPALAARSSSPTKGQSKPSSQRSFFASLG